MLTNKQFNKWIKNLRSGKYKQITGSLKRKGSYCALGLLYCKNTWAFSPLPTVSYTERCELIKRNDKLKQSFTEIADYLEENKERYVL